MYKSVDICFRIRYKYVYTTTEHKMYSIREVKTKRKTIYILRQDNEIIARSTNKNSLHRLLAQLMGIKL